MKKKIIDTPLAPRAAGPYSQAVQANGFVFVSGQLPIDPETGVLISGDIGRAADRVIENIKNILEAAGSSLGDVVKMTVYLKTMDDFAQMNAAYALRFTQAPPARVCVAVKELPKGADIEMDAIAAAVEQ